MYTDVASKKLLNPVASIAIRYKNWVPTSGWDKYNWADSGMGIVGTGQTVGMGIVGNGSTTPAAR